MALVSEEVLEVIRVRDQEEVVVLNCSGRGDKDMGTIAQYL